MQIKRIAILSILALSSTSLAFALSLTSPSFTLKGARIVGGGGRARSSAYILDKVSIGNILGGKAKGVDYTLDAGKLLLRVSPQLPPPPTVNPVESPTRQPRQTLSGTKERDTSLYINGYLAIPLNEKTSWSYTVSLEEGENYFLLTCRNKEGLESEAVLVTITLDTSPPLLSISVSGNRWEIGEVHPGSTITMPDTQKITVTNTGEVEVNLVLSLTNPAHWQAASTTGAESFVLNAAFASRAAHITWDEEEHLVTTQPTTCTESRFATDENGAKVPPGESRNLFLQFKAPTRTQVTQEQAITLTISCELATE